MKAIVLAGGMGKRLAGAIGGLPKPMATVGTRPFLEYLLDYLADQGIAQVVLAVSHKWNLIREHFGNGYRGMQVDYSVEDVPLGTGGAIRKALGMIGGDEITVLNGDTLFPVDLRDMANVHNSCSGRLTIAAKHMDECGRFGRLAISDSGIVTEFLEKSANGPGWINGGVYMLNRSLLADYPVTGSFSFEEDLVAPYLDTISPCAYLSNAYFIDMGVPEDYERACAEIGSSR